MPSFLKNLIFGILFMGMISCGAGCTVLPSAEMAKSLGMKWSGKKVYPHESQGNPVVKVISIWQPGSGVAPDGKSSRGFSGQIMFFTSREQAISVIEGGATIYVFDDQGTREEQVKPIHIWEFKPEVWKAFKVDSPMGPTYQVFIPYSRSGSHEANCSLRVKYQPLNGGAVSSEMVNVTLEGTKKEAVEKLASAKLPERRDVSFDEESEEESESQELTETTDSPKFRQKQVDSVPLNQSERERILREFQEEQGDTTEGSPQDQERGSQYLNQKQHILDGDEEAEASPSERFGLKPEGKHRTGINGWAAVTEQEPENPPGSEIRQVAWETNLPESVDQKNAVRPRSATREVRRKKRETAPMKGERRGFQVHTIPLN